MSTVPVDSRAGVALTVSVDREVSIAAVREEALVVDAEAVDGRAIGDSSRVRTSQADGGSVGGDDVQVLPARRGLARGGEGHGAVGGAVDCRVDWLGIEFMVFVVDLDEGYVRMRISRVSEVLPPA